MCPRGATMRASDPGSFELHQRLVQIAETSSAGASKIAVDAEAPTREITQ